MGVAASLILFTAGAVMRFAVSATSPDFNVRTVGAILMIVGGVGFLVSLIYWGTWGGFGTFRRERHVIRRQETSQPAAPPQAGTRQPYVGPAGYEEEEIRQLS
jgi:hypothetical protein